MSETTPNLDELYSTPMGQVSTIIGWLYVVCWALVSYPQIILNFRLKSVEGFKLDFPFLNLSGFIFYSISMSIPYFYKLPYDNYGFGTVRIQDVVFALHGVFVNLIFNLQALFLKRGKNGISKVTIWMTIIAWTTSILFYLFSEVFEVIPISGSINILKYIGIQKILVTLYKYAPLAYWNYVRKSTQGFTIISFLLDFAGGTLSQVQLFIDYGIGITNTLNLVKLLLGLVSAVYDVILMYQHFILYKGNKPKETASDDLNAKLIAKDIESNATDTGATTAGNGESVVTQDTPTPAKDGLAL